MSIQIDILMAVYNGQKYLEPQIESILNQTHRNIRLIVRDDASKDRSADILRRWQKNHPEKMRLLPADQNLGVVGNFAALMAASEAPYIMFADQDDVWKIDKAARTAAKMRELEYKTSKTHPLLVHTDLRVVDQELREIAPSFCRFANLFPYKSKTLARQLSQNTITGCTVMVNRPLLDLATPIPVEDVVMHDWWLGLTAAAFGKIGFVSEQTVLYRQHESNDTGAKKFGLRTFWRDKSKRAEIKAKCERQALAFLLKYKDRLPSDKLSVIDGYLRLQDASISAERLYLMLRYGLYKQGVLRNLNQVLLG
jgi:glycosyltransferase involved in cell wall biosynthesis